MDDGFLVPEINRCQERGFLEQTVIIMIFDEYRISNIYFIDTFTVTPNLPYDIRSSGERNSSKSLITAT